VVDPFHERAREGTVRKITLRRQLEIATGVWAAVNGVREAEARETKHRWSEKTLESMNHTQQGSCGSV